MEVQEYIRKKRQKGMLYIPYLTIGDPSLEKTVEFAVGVIDAGADILELGIPFSDPTADGSAIQAAMNRSFQKKSDLSLSDIFHVCQEIHLSRPEIPLVFFELFESHSEWSGLPSILL